ncbi:MAG: response regulator, partial [Proteobacteria bacterium]|nr:response regulator [Pseudomonadota bacterium]
KALDILAEKMDDIDMLILDMNMPEMTGIEVMQALQYLDTARSLPIIMLTADATPQAKEECLNAGANAFLTKPIDSRSLLEHVANLAPTITAESLRNPESRPLDTSSLWIDEAIINELTLLGGNDLFMQTLIQGFEFDGEKHIKTIKHSAHDDYLTYRESLHALKGSATEMGAIKLVDLCNQAEVLKPYDVGTQHVIALCDEIENVFLKTVSALQLSINTTVEQSPSQ